MNGLKGGYLWGALEDYLSVKQDSCGHATNRSFGVGLYCHTISGALDPWKYVLICSTFSMLGKCQGQYFILMKLLNIKKCSKFRITILYELKFLRWFYFCEFRESNPRENFHFNLCLFIVMTTSAKSRN